MFSFKLHGTPIGFIEKKNRKSILEHLLDSISLSNEFGHFMKGQTYTHLKWGPRFKFLGTNLHLFEAN